MTNFKVGDLVYEKGYHPDEKRKWGGTGAIFKVVNVGLYTVEVAVIFDGYSKIEHRLTTFDINNILLYKPALPDKPIRVTEINHTGNMTLQEISERYDLLKSNNLLITD